MEPHVQRAIAAFQSGQPVCLFDSEKREGETDLLFPGASAVPATMRQLRQDCGGLLFLAIGDEVGEFMPHPIVSAPVVGLRSCRMLGKGDPPLPAGEAGSDMGDSGSDGSATSDAMRCRPSDATQ